MPRRKTRPTPTDQQPAERSAEAQTNRPAERAADFNPSEFGPGSVQPVADAGEGPAAGRPARVSNPDPHDIDQITLGDTKDSPRMRLLRSSKFDQMQIRFDVKPDKKYRDRLADAGWRWRNEEGVWTIQLDKDARWRTQADAEALFREIGSAARADLGLPAQELGR